MDLKGETLARLAEKYNINKNEILSIGNDVEDISMFKVSGRSVLVEGGYEENFMKEFADYSVSNLKNKAVALVLKKLI